MGSEYFINSQELENKVRNLLPSQGGAGAGFDLSASTQIIPIIDLTESAEGSNVRQDLQSALSFNSGTNYSISNTTSDIIVNTGYYRIYGVYQASSTNSSALQLTDGVSTKTIQNFGSGSGVRLYNQYEFLVFIPAGQSLIGTSNSTAGSINGITRQIADIDGNLTSP